VVSPRARRRVEKAVDKQTRKYELYVEDSGGRGEEIGGKEGREREEKSKTRLTVDLVRQPSPISQLAPIHVIPRQELPSCYRECVPSEVDEEGGRVDESFEPVELGEVWDPLSEGSWAAGGRGAREVESIDGERSEEGENGSAKVASELGQEKRGKEKQ